MRTQRLLFPQSLDLEPRQVQAAEAHGDVLARLGFDLEPLSGKSIAIKAVPEAVVQANLSVMLCDLLDDLGRREVTEVVAAHLDGLLATMACHGVIRAGDTLDEQRVRALLGSLDGVDVSAHRPHGRPVLLRISLGELERRFGRT